MLNIAFHQHHLTERGTTIALLDYAYYNEKILGNKSLIIYQKGHPVTHPKTEELVKKNCKYKTYPYRGNNTDLEKILKDNCIDAVYHICYANPDNGPVSCCLNLVHAVFDIRPTHSSNEKYAAISKHLADSRGGVVPFVPHMIIQPPFSLSPRNMREELKIPEDAIVFGRHGGKDTFSINYVKSAIKTILGEKENFYFLFLNTDKFLDHPRIIHLDTIAEINEKYRFINTCDAMIHARNDGETFGLSVGEFSVCNKPVLTTKGVYNGANCHIEILGDKGLIYNSEQELLTYMRNIKEIITQKEDWNAYREYSPKKVMEKFEEVFLKDFYSESDTELSDMSK